MSTLSAQLLMCSSSITEDFYKGFLRPNASQRELVWVGRAMVLAISVIAILISSDPNSRVLSLVSYAWAGFGAAFGPVVILSLFWKRMTEAGALVGMIVGALVVVAWKPLTGSSLYEIIPGFIACTLAVVMVSLMGKPNPNVEARFEQAEDAYKKAL